MERKALQKVLLQWIVIRRRRIKYRKMYLQRKLKAVIMNYSDKTSKLFKEFDEIVNLYIPRDRRFMAKPRSNHGWLELYHGDAEDFKEAFRMLKPLFTKIVEDLRADLTPKPNPISTRKPTSVEKQVGICLYKLASCCEYRVVGRVFGVHKSTVHKFFYQVVQAINRRLLWKTIQMPDAEESKQISESFQMKSALPQIIGCIDGSHIPILPPTEGSKDFINRKHYASIVLQAVVDNNCRFRDISCKYPGSVHDSSVFKGSSLYKNIDTVIPQSNKIINGVKIPYFIIGDPAYELQPWLMKDYPGRGLGADKQHFNESLNSARVHVEMAFGRLKGRFRMLLKRSDIHYTFMPEVIAACCTLHNLIEDSKDHFPARWLPSQHDLDLFPQPAPSTSHQFDSFTAMEIRDTLRDLIKK